MFVSTHHTVLDTFFHIHIVDGYLNSRCEGLDVEDFPLFKDDLDILPHLGTNEEVASLQTVHRAKFLLNIFEKV